MYVSLDVQVFLLWFIFFTFKTHKLVLSWFKACMAIFKSIQVEIMELDVLNQIEKMIYVIRNEKVMLDFDLAKLYGVETRVLNQAVKRNKERFPADFMIQLTIEELQTLNQYYGPEGGSRNSAFAFTENGVAMLSSVLNSSKAIQVNISIMRIFTKLRSFLFLEQDLRNEMKDLKENTNNLFKIVFERLDAEISYDPDRKKIGLKS